MSHVKLLTVYSLLLIMVIFTTYAEASDVKDICAKHPIYCQIVNNKPRIEKSYAFKLSNVIYKKARQHKIDPAIFTAILAQESMYTVSAKNCTTGLIFVEEMPNSYVKQRVCTDFGIGQIWYKTAGSYEFDIEKLTTDMDYSVDAAALVLKHFKKRYSHKESDWWTRYNASSRNARDKYKELVERFVSPE